MIEFFVTELKAAGQVVVSAKLTIAVTHQGVTLTSFFPVSFAEPDPLTFTPFDDLTEAQVIEWAKAQSPVDDIVAGLIGVIDDRIQAAPVAIVSVSPPWAKAP
jgi:hypothetical protein